MGFCHIAQNAYRKGQASMGAERIDNDAVWINGVGGIERQPDSGIDTSVAAAEIGRKGGKSTSEAKRRAARENGRKSPGRPKKV